MPDNLTNTEQQEMQEIIGAMPSRIWRRGILLVLGLVVLLIVVAHFVRYPDVIEVPVELRVNEVVDVRADYGGTLDHIIVQEGNRVEKGEVLLVFKGRFEYDELNRLAAFLESLSRRSTVAEVAAMVFPESLNLSVLPAETAKLKQDIKDLSRKYFDQHPDQQVSRLNKEKEILNRLTAAAEKQIDKIEEETRLAEKNYQDYKSLLESGAASSVEADAAQATLLRLQATLESHKAELIRYELDHSGLDTQIELLRHEVEEALWQEFGAVHRRSADIYGMVQDWLNKNVVYAPVGGKVVFPERLLEGQSVSSGATLLSIIISGPGEKLQATGQLAGEGTGKVEPGMNVHLRLQAYPYKEYGELPGKVEKIGGVSASGFFEIIIDFPNDWKDDRNVEKMEFKPGMVGIARVITEDRSLLERFLEIFQV
ncbi:MAG: HlyD family efflux transporter periplasmic adaptor subunit [Bacteroidetes bacterium]|nr:MAG: HlyD family efflux transporter periplasmic adaptor subunit [Bacteroidota bacterium]